MGGGGQSPATHLGGNQFFYFKTQSNPQHTHFQQKKGVGCGPWQPRWWSHHSSHLSLMKGYSPWLLHHLSFHSTSSKNNNCSSQAFTWLTLLVYPRRSTQRKTRSTSTCNSIASAQLMARTPAVFSSYSQTLRLPHLRVGFGHHFTRRSTCNCPRQKHSQLTSS